MTTPETDSDDMPIRHGCRLSRAIGFSVSGIRHAFTNEAAIRNEFISLSVLVPISALLPVTDIEHLVLVLSMMLVVLVEFINSAIETTVNRISIELHTMSKQAKDMASAAVLISVLMSGLCWTVIAGPVLLKWLRS